MPKSSATYCPPHQERELTFDPIVRHLIVLDRGLEFLDVDRFDASQVLASVRQSQHFHSPQHQWLGPAFLAEPWHFDVDLGQRMRSLAAIRFQTGA